MQKPIPVEPILRENIIKLAKACAKARGVKLNTLSGECHNDSRFLEKLIAKKCSVTLRKYDSVIAYFFDDSKWPEGVERPAIRLPFQS